MRENLGGQIPYLIMMQMGKAPLLQLKVCSTENAFPQMQLVGGKDGVQQYLKKTASLNALLCKVKPMFSIGRCGGTFLPSKRQRSLLAHSEKLLQTKSRSSFCFCHFPLLRCFSFPSAAFGWRCYIV